MIKIIKDIKKVQKSNLIYLIEKLSDLNKLKKDFKLNKNIINKIKDLINKKQNLKFEFFIWEKQFEKLVIFFYLDSKKEDLLYFLWKNVINLDNKITILSNKKQNLIKLLDSIVLSRYKFQKYKSKIKKDDINIIVDFDNKKEIQERISTLENIIYARDLWETPSSDLTPEQFVKIIKKTKFKNIKIKILNYKQIEKKWLGLIKAVWKWSINKPYVVILEKISNKKNKTIGFVWKWITFDTGWIQVKPWDFMYEMKWDMWGAANLFCIMKELDKKKLNINIVSCLVLAENCISGESYKPSDIITSYSWKTVDIIHTDAEWRLVLADGISYISKNYKLDKIITIATLTWACMVALGFRYAGIMWNDKELIKKFINYSKNNFEKYCELPFDNYFIEKTKSKIADLENLNKWIYAWSTMWATFLYNFILNNEKYMHIDIAWTALNSYEAYWLANKWMTGFWVDSISNILLNLK